TMLHVRSVMRSLRSGSASVAVREVSFLIHRLHRIGNRICVICGSMKITVAILVMVASLMTAAGQQRQAQLDTLRAEGYDALYNLDYEGARRRFQKMVDLAPDDPVGAQCLASSLWLRQLNESWELKATLYSTGGYTDNKAKIDRRQA